MKRIKKGIKIFGYIILLCLVTLCITTFVQVDIMNKKYANIFSKINNITEEEFLELVENKLLF